jgi:hypothetical protein
MEHLNGEEKRFLRDMKHVEDIEGKLGPEEQKQEEQELKTTNGVF